MNCRFVTQIYVYCGVEPAVRTSTSTVHLADAHHQGGEFSERADKQ